MASLATAPSVLRHAIRIPTGSLRARIPKIGTRTITLPRSYATAVDPATHVPSAKYSSPAVHKMLGQSILKWLPDEEVKSRIELAAAYRLFELKNWNENIYNHLTAKVKEEDGSDSFLINPFGLRYGEVTASSLIKVGADGKIKDHGVTGDTFGINDAGWVIHSAIHRARPDVASVMHCHYPPATGLACTKDGLLELAQTTHQAGPVSYHDYQGIVTNRGEQKSLAEDLGSTDTMILRNHGVITAAETISAAWYLMYELLAASEIQSHASACALGDKGNLIQPEEIKIERTWNATREKGFSGSKFGLKEMSAYMRLLDQKDPSYRI
ncbi:hypothetical protein DTO006G1_1694 [Penicillium roqueforti]|nr:hypothetical protein CBS147337_6458 [Penicillium roqueforti]KAI2730648.1 hypothetical protein CBS147332_2500 [Penicillium roqueforti]KAI2763353.1 hypothetical protein DTO006G1_1694 [Penicillium roqueforti]KAI3110017.1 hypothetical protein CBS147331_5446 [Penicillium roqueforti]KAI3230641.1 hypothetical protein DTO012A9_8280 [Penicillium roqueforti]